MPNNESCPGIFVAFDSHGSPPLPEPATHNWSRSWNIISQKRSGRCPHTCDILVSRGGRDAKFDSPGLNTTLGQHDPDMEPTWETNIIAQNTSGGAQTPATPVCVWGGRACWISAVTRDIACANGSGGVNAMFQNFWCWRRKPLQFNRTQLSWQSI